MTFVDFGMSAYNGTSPQTASVDVETDDIILVAATAFDSATTWNLPSDGSNTYASLDTGSGSGKTQIWTATAAGNATLTVTMTIAASASQWGFSVHVFRDVTVGAHANGNGSGAPLINLVTGTASSTILFVCCDSNESGTARTWRTINGTTPTAGNGLETLYADIAFWIEAHGAYWPDAGTAGSKSTGMTAPSGQAWTGVAVELAPAGGGGFNPALASMMTAMF